MNKVPTGFSDMTVLSGNAHKSLAKDICKYLGIPLGKVDVFKFKNDNTFVRILENIRQRDVFIVQPMTRPVNDHIMELLIMIDAAKRASAGRITAVVPYYGYGRSDKKDQPRVPITGRLVADLVTVAGADRVLTVDLHQGQIQGFFDIPVDELTAEGILVNYFKAKEIEGLVVVATDIGISKKARDVAVRLDAPLAIVEKRRMGNHDEVQSMRVIGDVRGHPVLTFDDEIDTGGSTVTAMRALTEAGATKVYSCATHGVFSNGAVQRIVAEDSIKEMVVTDTIPIPPESRAPKLTILSTSSLIGEAMRRIHYGESVGALFT